MKKPTKHVSFVEVHQYYFRGEMAKKIGLEKWKRHIDLIKKPERQKAK